MLTRGVELCEHGSKLDCALLLLAVGCRCSCHTPGFRVRGYVYGLSGAPPSGAPLSVAPLRGAPLSVAPTPHGAF